MPIIEFGGETHVLYVKSTQGGIIAGKEKDSITQIPNAEALLRYSVMFGIDS